MLTPTSEFIPSPFGNHMTALCESVKDFFFKLWMSVEFCQVLSLHC